MDTNDTPTGADTARPPRKTTAKADPPQPAPAPVTVLVKPLKAGLTIAGARVAKGHPMRVTEEVAAFHEKRGDVVIVGTA